MQDESLNITTWSNPFSQTRFWQTDYRRKNLCTCWRGHATDNKQARVRFQVSFWAVWRVSTFAATKEWEFCSRVHQQRPMFLNSIVVANRKMNQFPLHIPQLAARPIRYHLPTPSFNPSPVFMHINGKMNRQRLVRSPGNSFFAQERQLPLVQSAYPFTQKGHCRRTLCPAEMRTSDNQT